MNLSLFLISVPLFKLSINTVLNLVNLHPEKEIEKILRMSFYSYQKYGTKYDQKRA